MGTDTVRTHQHQTAVGDQDRDNDDDNAGGRSRAQAMCAASYVPPTTVRAGGARTPPADTNCGQVACAARAREHRPDRVSRRPRANQSSKTLGCAPGGYPGEQAEEARGGARHDTRRFPPIVSRKHPSTPVSLGGDTSVPPQTPPRSLMISPHPLQVSP